MQTQVPLGGTALPKPRGAEAGFAASGTCVCMSCPIPQVEGWGYVQLPYAVWIVTGGAASRCLRSLEPADAWSSSDLPLACGTASQGAFGAAFWMTSASVDDARGVVAGGYRSCATWLDEERVLAVGERGASLSVDGGKTWQPFGESGFHTVDGGGASVFACGSGGRIARLVAEPRRE